VAQADGTGQRVPLVVPGWDAYAVLEDRKDRTQVTRVHIQLPGATVAWTRAFDDGDVDLHFDKEDRVVQATINAPGRVGSFVATKAYSSLSGDRGRQVWQALVRANNEAYLALDPDNEGEADIDAKIVESGKWAEKNPGDRRPW